MYTSHRSHSRQVILTRFFVLPLLSLMLLFGAASPAAAGEEGSWILQCGCYMGWTDTWLGDAAFDSRHSLDTVILVNDDAAVVLMHELPLARSDMETMLAERTAELEDHDTRTEVEVVWDDVNATDAEAGRTWLDASGQQFVSFQSIVVWEKNFLLSVELISPAATFEAAWSDLGDITLPNTTPLNAYDGDEIATRLGL